MSLGTAAHTCTIRYGQMYSNHSLLPVAPPLSALEPGTPIFDAPRVLSGGADLRDGDDDAQSLSASLSFSYSHVSRDSSEHEPTASGANTANPFDRVFQLVHDAHQLGWHVDERDESVPRTTHRRAPRTPTVEEEASDGAAAQSFVLRAPPTYRATMNARRMQRVLQRARPPSPTAAHGNHQSTRRSAETTAPAASARIFAASRTGNNTADPQRATTAHIRTHARVASADRVAHSNTR